MTDSDTTRTPNPPEDVVPPPVPPAVRAAAPPPPPLVAPAAPPPPAGPPASSWRPPQSDSGRNASLVFGVIILIIGAWFFATRTLGLDLPDFDWGALWPLILIGIGAWIVLGALRQRSR